MNLTNHKQDLHIKICPPKTAARNFKRYKNGETYRVRGLHHPIPLAVNSSQIDLSAQCNLNKNLSRFCKKQLLCRT